MGVLWNVLNKALKENANALISEHNGNTQTYGNLLLEIEEKCSSLDKRNLYGLKCIILCKKSSEALKMLLLCWSLDMVAIPASFHYGEDNINSILNVTKPDLILTDDEDIDIVGNVPIFTFSNWNGNNCGQETDLELDKIEILMCTSGTTGKPKASMLTGQAIATNINMILNYFQLDSADNILVCRPLYHCAVLVGEVLVSIIKGVNILFYSGGFNPIIVSRIVFEKNITVMCGTPTILKGVADYLKYKDRTKKLHMIAVSGEFLLPEYASKIEEAFPETQIYNVYGLTEAGPRVSYLPYKDFDSKPESVGIPLKGVKIRIVSKGGLEKKGKIGNIQIKTPSLMKGYYGSLEKTISRFCGEWFDTGDIGYFDENGYLYVVGRSDDMIIKSGINIYPQEVESKLVKMVEIEDAIVYGKLEKNIEQIYADIIPSQLFKDISEQEMKIRISKIIPSFLMPYEIHLVEHFPRNASGKVMRPHFVKRELFDYE